MYYRLPIELSTAVYDYEPGPGLALVLKLYACRSLDCEVRVGRVRCFNPKYCSESWPTWGLAVWVKLISRSRAWSPFLSLSLFVFYAPQLLQYALVISQYYFGYGNTLPYPVPFLHYPPRPTAPDIPRGLIISIPTSIEQTFLYGSEDTKRWADTRSGKLTFRANFWVVTLYSLFGRYQRFRVTCCLNLKYIPKDVEKLVKIKEGNVYPIKDDEGPDGLHVLLHTFFNFGVRWECV
jgi:hypothetical protein